MPSLDESFRAVASALAERYGSSAPGSVAADPFRAILETFLATAADARKVTRALDRLAEDGLAEADAFASAGAEEIGDVLRECGIGSAPKLAATAQRLARWVADRSAEVLGDPDAASTEQLRDALLSLNGIGPATADALLLFALHRPAYPIDRASYRVLARHGWIDSWAEYDAARDVVERACADDADALARLSAWMKRLGRDYCKPSVARCEHCPLSPFLPAGGLVSLDGE